MYKIAILLAVGILLLPTTVYPQKKIKRNRHLEGILDSTSLDLKRQSNLFDDYGWLKPDIKSKKISISNGETKNANEIQIASAGEGQLKLIANGKELTAEKAICKNCYWDISTLKLKPVTTTQWVPVTTYQMETVMVTRTRQVTRYQYNYTTKTSQPVYSTENYFAYEHRSVPKTTYTYKSTTTYVLDIPVTTIYEYKDVFEPYDRYLVYEFGDADNKVYYLQPTSYFIATTEDGINYVFLDVDGNGKFTDEQDRIAFNTWNPFSEKSKFKPMKHFKENRWYSQSELKNKYFIDFEFTSGNQSLFSTNQNKKFQGEKDYGALNFENLPKDCKLEVNGKEYGKPEKGFKVQHGCYLLTIKRKGYLDFTQSVCITKDNPSETINYQETPTGKLLRIDNIFSTNYFITVKGESGYEANYFNRREFQVPNGTVTISIDNSGYVLEKEYDLASMETLVIDYESQIKELLPEDPESPNKEELEKKEKELKPEEELNQPNTEENKNEKPIEENPKGKKKKKG